VIQSSLCDARPTKTAPNQFATHFRASPCPLKNPIIITFLPLRFQSRPSLRVLFGPPERNDIPINRAGPALGSWRCRTGIGAIGEKPRSSRVRGEPDALEPQRHSDRTGADRCFVEIRHRSLIAHKLLRAVKEIADTQQQFPTGLANLDLAGQGQIKPVEAGDVAPPTGRENRR